MAKPQTLKRLTPVAAVDRLEELYVTATSALSAALDGYLENRKPPAPATRAEFRYPLLRLAYRDHNHTKRANRRAFAKLQQSGVYETTITHPGPFRGYLLEQLVPLSAEY